MFKEKASVTVFMIMTILLIAAVLFALIEGVRYAAINRISSEYSDAAVESAFSYYVRPLWDDYGILGIDLGFGSSTADVSELNRRMDGMLVRNCGGTEDSRINLIAMSETTTETVSYCLLTDSKGAGFIKEAADTETLNEIADYLRQDGVNLSMTDLDLDALLENGNKVIANSDAELTEASAPMPDAEVIEVEENPVDTVIAWKNQTILSQVMDVNTLSTAAIATDSLVSHRQINAGTGENVTVGPTEKLLFRKYIIDTLQSYTTNRGRENMSYELEYVLSGKDSDSANLEACVVKLLAVREVENFIAILQDQRKTETAGAIALGLAGETLSPEAVEMVKYAVIAAWAYVESVLDVRLLLTGGKVAMIKTSAEWTSDPTKLAEYLDTGVKAKECTNGLSYSDYIYQLLILTSDKTAAFRTMDIMEYRIRQKENYSEFRMDNVLYDAKFEVRYEVKPLFLSLTGVRADGYTITRAVDMSYS